MLYAIKQLKVRDTTHPLLMVFINGNVIQRATNIAAYDGCHDGHQATG